MKKIISFFTLLTLIGITSSFLSQADSPVDRVQQAYANNIDEFDDAIERYLETAQKENCSQSELLEKHLACRRAYKKIEYLLTLFEHRFAKVYLNGPPLPVIQQSSGLVEAVDPEGLQILDELVVEEELDMEEIITKIRNLKASFAKLSGYEKKRTFNERYILNAMRLQLIRILSLGITGFDTPGSLNGLEEAKTSLETMSTDFQQFKNVYPDAKKYYERARKLYRESIQYLAKNRDFDTFNRLYFIRSLINPLYEEILNFVWGGGIEVYYEKRILDEAINFKARTPFSNDFMNPYYFMYLQPDEDNEKIVELGSYLFFEPVLSGTNKMSCATCHQPQKGFTDGLKTSISNDGVTPVARNSFTLINAIYADRHFYDLRANKIEHQIQQVAINPLEFHTDFEAMSDKLAQSEEYQRLFAEAFPYARKGKEGINQHTISTAIASYVKTIRSFNSPFDRYIRGESDRIDRGVAQGFNLFMGKAACGTCHFAPTFSGLVPPKYNENETEVLGVPADKEGTVLDADIGRLGNNRKSERVEHFRHSFKTPTIRNIALSAPYMHNGVYETLDEVLDFYNRGGGAGMGLEVPFQTLAPDSLQLTVNEQKSIIRFMESLTDTSYQIRIPDKLPAFPPSSPLGEIERELSY